MDEKMVNQLTQAGIDVQEAMARFMDNEGLMKKFLLRFPQDESFAQLKQALGKKNAEEAYRAAHTLKGLAGNLAMKSLFDQVCSVLDDLRKQDLEQVEEKMKELEARYQRILAALQFIE